MTMNDFLKAIRRAERLADDTCAPQYIRTAGEIVREADSKQFAICAEGVVVENAFVLAALITLIKDVDPMRGPLGSTLQAPTQRCSLHDRY
jgi:hypothetical protein